MPNRLPKPQPATKPHPFRRTAIPLITVKDRRVIEFVSSVVRSQCLNGGLSVDSAQAFPGLVCLLVERLSEPKDSFAKPSSHSWQMPGSKENED